MAIIQHDDGTIEYTDAELEQFHRWVASKELRKQLAEEGKREGWWGDTAESLLDIEELSDKSIEYREYVTFRQFDFLRFLAENELRERVNPDGTPVHSEEEIFGTCMYLRQQDMEDRKYASIWEKHLNPNMKFDLVLERYVPIVD